MLNNFFKINLPYGIQKNENDEWSCFNREYKPLGTKDSSTQVDPESFIYTKYKGLTERTLKKLAFHETSIHRTEGKIVKVFFYNDRSNPSNFNQKALYKDYFDKIEILSKLQVKIK